MTRAAPKPACAHTEVWLTMRVCYCYYHKRRYLMLTAVAVFLCVITIVCGEAYTLDGIGGLEGSGISSGAFYAGAGAGSGTGSGAGGGRGAGGSGTALDYQEYTFITGEPVLLKGTLIIGKSDSSGVLTSTYSYKLNNTARKFQLTRDISYETVTTEKDNGQTVTVTRLARDPSEKIVTGNGTYTLRRMDFTRTSLIDAKPAVNYYSGNTWYRKQYEVGGGTATSSSGDYLMVEATGQFYGFDEAWGSADVEDTDFVIEYSQSSASTGNSGMRELWSGTANVRRSQSAITELRYIENEPEAISFRGGYLETRNNKNTLEFSARLPEFDAGGNATDRIKKYADDTQISTFPSTRRLVAPYLRQIAGHWSEEAVAKLFGLEILTTRPSEFIPDQTVTRSEFAAMLVAAAPPVPADPSVRQRGGAAKAAGKGKASAAPAPSFTDVPADREYFPQIEEAYARRLMNPIDKFEFRPDGKVTVADAAVTFIRALGLEAQASAHGAVTEFSDDDGIPGYARDALYVAQRIGLLRGDGAGRIYPLKELTRAEAAVMLDRFVEYMMGELRSDYSDRFMDYN